MTIQKSRFSSEAAPQPAGSQPPQPSLAKWLPLTSQYIEGKAVQTVNARELHSFLKVGRDFSNWIKDRIAEYGFVEGVDYVVFTKFGENPQGGRPQKEYAIRLDMGKELAMVERNDEGRRARRYFIDCAACTGYASRMSISATSTAAAVSPGSSATGWPTVIKPARWRYWSTTGGGLAMSCPSRKSR